MVGTHDASHMGAGEGPNVVIQDRDQVGAGKGSVVVSGEGSRVEK